MTDRIHSLIVVLEHEVREDDIRELQQALRLFRGVATVELNVTDPAFYVAREQARVELARKVWEAVKP